MGSICARGAKTGALEATAAFLRRTDLSQPIARHVTLLCRGSPVKSSNVREKKPHDSYAKLGWVSPF